MDKELFNQIVTFFGGPTQMARTLDVGRAFVYAVRDGRRPMPPVRALQIERLSDGKFKAVDMNPKCAVISEVA